MTKTLSVADQIAEDAGNYYADLGAFITWAYPWKEKGSALEHFDGPEYWVLDLADEISDHVAKHGFNGHDPVEPVYVAVASGNGAAKSTFAGMFNNWIQSTRPMSRVTATANTGAQLRTKTWPEIKKWTQLSLTGSWFEIQEERIFHREYPSEWVTHAHTWNIGNTQASAGQHARTASSVYLIDEASHVPEPIHEQFDGGLTDGEPFYVLLGNCTNRASRLFRAVFGDLKKFYINRSIDTRKCKYTNKALIKKWEEQRGADSDWFKSHVKGEAPSADDLQLIDSATVQGARTRPVPIQDDSTPLILGIDFARGGSNDNRLSWRRGRDMRSIPSRKIPGTLTRDSMLTANIINQEIAEKRPDYVFGDAGAMGGPILDRLRQLNPKLPIIDVMFGGASPDPRYGNMRAYMWFRHKEWLPGGCIEDDEQIEVDLTGPGTYQQGQEGRTFIESKEDMADRGLDSPDWADSQVLTHAMPVAAVKKQPTIAKKKISTMPRRSGKGWMRR